MADLRPEAAEALGLFVIVFCGGAAVFAGGGLVGVALAWAFAVAVMVYSVGHVSGAHFNPAITVAFAAMGHFPWRRVLPYVGAQVVGALLAALVIRAIGDPARIATHPGFGVGLGEAFLVEAIATAVLAFVIIAVATDRRAAQGLAGLAIGLTVGLDILWAGPLTGASMNPARTLGPALAAWTWRAAWLYLLAPTVGACAGMAAYECLRPGHKPERVLGALGPVGEVQG